MAETQTQATTAGAAVAHGAGAGDVWVFVEQRDGVAAEVSLELLGRARELADRLGVKVGAMVAGAGAPVRALAPALVARGADTVYLADHDDLAQYLALPYTRLVAGLVRRHRPQIVLYGASTTGRDLGPRVASTLRTGLTADCTDLRIGDLELKGVVTKDLLYQIRPAFGGNIVATIVSPGHVPQMATVREGVMVMPEADESRSGDVVEVAVERGHVAAADGPILLDDADFAVRIVRRVQEQKSVDLKGARIVVSGGVGVGSAEGFALVEELAHTVGGVVGASRAAVDAGWIDHDHQVGQTGVTVRPKLYIACGISGSVQHRAGMDQSARILAINSDPGAPIFSVAHYGVVGDLHKVIPLLIRAYRKKGTG
ncbi:MAG: electron transfer flavoprotein subunit alpha/FixB family protein [Thermoleophilia bacterium]|nr:electron transfer flavoprotein subunit alpha/FixB family protein [Thermoleophilia bacterium]